MKIYLLTNKDNLKQAVLFEVSGADIISKHSKQRIYPQLYEDLRAGNDFDVVELAKPTTLSMGEQLESMYISIYNPEYNVT